MTTAPTPEVATVCTTCGHKWDGHMRSARARAEAERMEMFEDGDYDSSADLPKIEPVITYLDCVRVMQEANRGPVGPQGAMGMQGLPGKCKCDEP